MFINLYHSTVQSLNFFTAENSPLAVNDTKTALNGIIKISLTPPIFPVIVIAAANITRAIMYENICVGIFENIPFFLKNCVITLVATLAPPRVAKLSHVKNSLKKPPRFVK